MSRCVMCEIENREGYSSPLNYLRKGYEGYMLPSTVQYYIPDACTAAAVILARLIILQIQFVTCDSNAEKQETPSAGKGGRLGPSGACRRSVCMHTYRYAA